MTTAIEPQQQQHHHVLKPKEEVMFYGTKQAGIEIRLLQIGRLEKQMSQPSGTAAVLSQSFSNTRCILATQLLLLYASYVLSNIFSSTKLRTEKEGWGFRDSRNKHFEAVDERIKCRSRGAISQAIWHHWPHPWLA